MQVAYPSDRCHMHCLARPVQALLATRAPAQRVHRTRRVGIEFGRASIDVRDANRGERPALPTMAYVTPQSTSSAEEIPTILVRYVRPFNRPFRCRPKLPLDVILTSITVGSAVSSNEGWDYRTTPAPGNYMSSVSPYLDDQRLEHSFR